MMRWLQWMITGILALSVVDSALAEKIERISGFLQSPKEAFSLAQKNKKQVLVYFGLHHCGNCDLTKKHSFSSSQFESLSKNYIKLQILETDPSVEKYLEKYSISGAPTIVLANAKEELIAKSKTGFLNLEYLTRFLSKSQLVDPFEQIYTRIKQKKTVAMSEVEQLFASHPTANPRKTDILYRMPKDKETLAVSIKDWELRNQEKNCAMECLHQKAHLSRIISQIYRALDNIESSKNWMEKSLGYFRNFSAEKPSIAGAIGEMSNLVALGLSSQAIKRAKLAEKEFSENYSAITMGLVTSLRSGGDCDRLITVYSAMDRAKLKIYEDRFRIERNFVRCGFAAKKTAFQDRVLLAMREDLERQKVLWPKTHKRFRHKYKKLLKEVKANERIKLSN